MHFTMMFLIFKQNWDHLKNKMEMKRYFFRKWILQNIGKNKKILNKF